MGSPIDEYTLLPLFLKPFGGGQHKDFGAEITALQTQEKLSWQITVWRMLQRMSPERASECCRRRINTNKRWTQSKLSRIIERGIGYSGKPSTAAASANYMLLLQQRRVESTHLPFVQARQSSQGWREQEKTEEAVYSATDVNLNFNYIIDSGASARMSWSSKLFDSVEDDRISLLRMWTLNI